ncbi:TetR/AcrR family transcriptional regulator [Lentzea aerocolonigenes]|uniref:TetR/AcrR family transcriptional regulator n=1 Tax=Lentzea aerocolonigenes TaxID=68170 RepID=UPI0004C42876|nr:TetR/AcrR family transcriptional regulator [Lentzea aerocolonigenes]MCP2242256.1 transcriptional regulator, TetR family [Lentzea aerocolonigenes]
MKVERQHRPGGVPGALPGDRAAAIRVAALRLFATQGYRATTMADIGAAVGIRGPSIYKHVSGKQVLLAEIMLGTMDALIAAHAEATASAVSVGDQLRRAVEAHVRYHARHQLEAFVGNREIASLDQPDRDRVLRRRSTYERGFRKLIERGVSEGAFDVRSARLASYSILDMGMGVANWFHDGGEFSVDQLAYQYGDLALRVVGCQA